MRMACPATVDRRAASVGAGPTLHRQPAGLESFLLAYSMSGRTEAPSFSDAAPEQWINHERH